MNALQRIGDYDKAYPLTCVNADFVWLKLSFLLRIVHLTSNLAMSSRSAYGTKTGV